MEVREERCKHCGRKHGECQQWCPGYEDDGRCGALCVLQGNLMGDRCRLPIGHLADGEEPCMHSDEEGQVWWPDEVLTDAAAG
jgi:hypothetical protein